jgi:ankyrin repeat protein
MMGHICGCSPARVRHELENLPEALDGSYHRTLRTINKAYWEFAHRIFQFVAVASRPLRVEELAELLAFDFEARPIPKFHESWRLEDSVDAVLSTCSSLLSIVDGGYPFGKIIQFSHISVKEFLTSVRLAKASDIVTRRYHISMTRAHTLVAQACLGILLHLDKDTITSDSLERFPLAEYAAEHWADHARFEDVSRIVEDGMKQMFDSNKPHLAVCVWIHDPEFPTRGRAERAERPSPLTGTHLHYAALWGLRTMVEFLVIEHLQDVDSRGLTNMVTPLQLASKEGRECVAHFLLDRGADADARDDDNCTPLHWASQQGKLEVVRALVERGVDVNAQDHSNWTPLHGASQYGHLELVQFLLEHGADARASDQGGWTSLQWPSFNGDLDIVRVLLEHGADANTRDNSNWTPLHGASQQGHREVVQVLLAHGVDANCRDDRDQTPLRLASRAGHGKVVLLLVENGADIDVRNDEGRTPSEGTSAKGHHDVMQLLMGHGGEEDAYGAVMLVYKDLQ